MNKALTNHKTKKKISFCNKISLTDPQCKTGAHEQLASYYKRQPLLKETYHAPPLMFSEGGNYRAREILKKKAENTREARAGLLRDISTNLRICRLQAVVVIVVKLYFNSD